MEPAIQAFDDFEALRKAGDDLSKVHYIVLAERPGSSLFCTKLEYEHFPPRSGRNKLYDFYILKWPDDTMLWFVVGIPAGEQHIAEAVAKECGLVLRNGSPHIYDTAPDGVKEFAFPMSGPHVFVAESNSKSKLYENNPEMYASMMKGQTAECERIIEADTEKLREDLRRSGYTPEQVKRIIDKWYGGEENYMETPQGQPRHGTED